MSFTINRRTALRGLGTMMALPWLEAMAPAATAVTAGYVTDNAPIRMAFLYVPNGMHMPHWKPVGREFELPKILEPVQNFKNKMNLFSGLSLDGANAHGDGGGDHARSVASFLTGAHPRKNVW